MTVHLLCDCVHVCCLWHHINFHTHSDMAALCLELCDLKDKDTEKEIWICFSSVNGTWILFLHCVCKNLIWWSWRWICERNYLLLHFNGFSTSHFIKGIVLEDYVNCSSQIDWKKSEENFKCAAFTKQLAVAAYANEEVGEGIYWYFSLWKLWGGDGHSSERKPLWVHL